MTTSGLLTLVSVQSAYQQVWVAAILVKSAFVYSLVENMNSNDVKSKSLQSSRLDNVKVVYVDQESVTDFHHYHKQLHEKTCQSSSASRTLIQKQTKNVSVGTEGRVSRPTCRS